MWVPRAYGGLLSIQIPDEACEARVGGNVTCFAELAQCDLHLQELQSKQCTRH